MPQTETKASIFGHFFKSFVFRFYKYIVDQIGKWFIWHKNINNSDIYYNPRINILSASYDGTGFVDYDLGYNRGPGIATKETEVVDYIFQTSFLYGFADQLQIMSNHDAESPIMYAHNVLNESSDGNKFFVTSDQKDNLMRQMNVIQGKDLNDTKIINNYDMTRDLSYLTSYMNIYF